MMKKLTLISIALIAFLSLWAQQTVHVSLQDCQQNALINYPNFKQTELNNAIYELFFFSVVLINLSLDVFVNICKIKDITL